MQRPKDKNITIVNPVSTDGYEMLQELLRFFFNKNAGSPTLYIVDDCSATKELTKKKDRDSFEYCLRENDVIPTLEEIQRMKKELAKVKHRKLTLKTDQSTDYWIID